MHNGLWVGDFDSLFIERLLYASSEIEQHIPILGGNDPQAQIKIDTGIDEFADHHPRSRLLENARITRHQIHGGCESGVNGVAISDAYNKVDTPSLIAVVVADFAAVDLGIGVSTLTLSGVARTDVKSWMPFTVPLTPPSACAPKATMRFYMVPSLRSPTTLAKDWR